VTAYQSYISNKETKKIQNFLGTDSLIKSKTSSKSKSSTSMVKEIPLSNFKNTQVFLFSFDIENFLKNKYFFFI